MRRSFLVITAIPLIIIAIFAVFMLFTPEKSVNETIYGAETIAKDLEVPWALAFLPDDSLIFTERGGKVSILEGTNVKSVGNITVTQNSESGLLGIAVDPKFNENHYIYLYYTNGNNNQISRFILNDTLTNETVLVNNIPAAAIHNGGRLKFGPDGKLYATTEKLETLHWRRFEFTLGKNTTNQCGWFNTSIIHLELTCTVMGIVTLGDCLGAYRNYVLV
jgi:hypothetical protein